MMQNTRWAMGAAALALGLAIPAAAGPSAAPSARRQIQAIYRKIDLAIDQKDADTAFDYDADDCQYYDKKGHLLAEGSGRQEAVDVLDTVNTAKETTVITSFTGSDTDATVTTKGHVVLSLSNNINGRAAKISFDDISRDYWVKTDDGWKRKRSREIKGSFAVHKNF
jgi:hypothetical protein